MAAYLIVSTKILKSEGWEPYQSQVGDIFARFGGKYLVKRSNPHVLEGKCTPDRITIFEFPSMDAIQAMWDSPEYEQLRPLRAGLGDLDVIALAGI